MKIGRKVIPKGSKKEEKGNRKLCYRNNMIEINVSVGNHSPI